MKTNIQGLSNIKIKALSNRELLKLVEETRDQEGFDILFTRLGDMVRQEIFSMGSEVRRVRKQINTS